MGKKIFNLNQKTVDQVLQNLLGQLIQKGEATRQLHQATKLGKTTLRTIRLRQGLSAASLIKLFLAHGVSENFLMNLPRNRPTKISKTLTEWNKIGLSLTDKERVKVGKFLKDFEINCKSFKS